jgi:hypothetical protein
MQAKRRLQIIIYHLMGLKVTIRPTMRIKMATMGRDKKVLDLMNKVKASTEGMAH